MCCLCSSLILSLHKGSSVAFKMSDQIFRRIKKTLLEVIFNVPDLKVNLAGLNAGLPVVTCKIRA